MDLAELFTPTLLPDTHLIREVPVPQLHLQDSGVDVGGFQSSSIKPAWALFPTVSAVAPTQTPPSTILGDVVEWLPRSDSMSSTFSQELDTLNAGFDVPDQVCSTNPSPP
jgi:hypothetical protein